jgi:hypothetical protein
MGVPAMVTIVEEYKYPVVVVRLIIEWFKLFLMGNILFSY